MDNIIKFGDYIKKDFSFKKEKDDKNDIKKDNSKKELSSNSNINLLSGLDTSKLEKLKDGEFTIVGIQDISLEDPRINNPVLDEAMVISGDLGGKDVKRGDIIWITALIKKNNYNLNSMAVIKTRVVDLYQGMTALSNIK
jgi:hypothetical protein